MIANRRQAQAPAALQAPRLEHASLQVQDWFSAPVIEVLASGRMGDLLVQRHDLLVLDVDTELGDRVVVAPRRFGRPQLAVVTERGPRAANGVILGDRYQVLGRIALHVRTAPHRLPQVLTFPVGKGLRALPLAVSGPLLLLEFQSVQGRSVPVTALRLLEDRFPAVVEDGARVQVAVAGVFDGAEGLLRAGALVRELGERSGAQVRAVLAFDAADAVPALERLRFGHVAQLSVGCVVADGRPAPETPPETVEAAQLGLF